MKLFISIENYTLKFKKELKNSDILNQIYSLIICCCLRSYNRHNPYTVKWIILYNLVRHSPDLANTVCPPRSLAICIYVVYGCMYISIMY